MTPPPTGAAHVAPLLDALRALDRDLDRIDAWGRDLGELLLAGGRVLAAGNGGSAAEAQHLTAELVGRYRDDRPGLSAICLHGDSSSLTAIANDYGYEQAFARQVQAHGRRGDALVLLSTSGTSPNVLAAAEAARDLGVRTLALTGRGPNRLTRVCDDAVCVEAEATATVQEVHLVVVHLLCAAVESVVLPRTGAEIALP
jgi:D-sedoheptulose 7-phosphate isomerase